MDYDQCLDLIQSWQGDGKTLILSHEANKGMLSYKVGNINSLGIKFLTRKQIIIGTKANTWPSRWDTITITPNYNFPGKGFPFPRISNKRGDEITEKRTRNLYPI